MEPLQLFQNYFFVAYILVSTLSVLIGGLGLSGKRRSNFIVCALVQIHLVLLVGKFLLQFELGIVYCTIVILVAITWLFFYNWNWIIQNWWFTKSSANFKLLVPDLEYAVEVLTKMYKTKSFLLPEDMGKMGEILSRLMRMELLPPQVPPNKAQTPEDVAHYILGHFTMILEYAKAGKYKECKAMIDFLHSKQPQVPKEFKAPSATG